MPESIKPTQRRNLFLARILSVRLVVGLVISVACLIGFSLIAEDVLEKDSIVRLDIALDNELHATTTPQMVQVFRLISYFGSEIVFILSVILALYYLYKCRWLHLGVWVSAIAGGEILNLLLKAIFNRPRPSYALPFAQEINTSFPSGHAMLSVILYGLLAYFLVLTLKNAHLHIIVVFVAVLLSVLIGISRLYLGVHYLSDVIAGYLAGGIWLATCITTMNLLRTRHQNP